MKEGTILCCNKIRQKTIPLTHDMGRNSTSHFMLSRHIPLCNNILLLANYGQLYYCTLVGIALFEAVAKATTRP